jgi:hypothetical protein
MMFMLTLAQMRNLELEPPRCAVCVDSYDLAAASRSAGIRLLVA